MKIDIRIRSSEGAEFDCYLVTPDVAHATAAVVLASAIHGADEDLRAMGDSFAARGYIAAVPDLFWRTVPGPLKRDDPRAAQRAQPRLEKIRAGERDLADVRSMLDRQPLFNGHAALMGFCYSGPYAILGPKRLGFDAGIACHGTQMLDFLGELEGMERPVLLLWGDRDYAAPAEVLDAYRALPARMPNVEVHVLPGAEHGYMMRGSKAFDPDAHDFSMARACEVMERLRTDPSEGRQPAVTC